MKRKSIFTISMQFEYDATLDVCPLPLVRLRVLLKKMEKNDVCRLLIADSGSKQNIPDFLARFNFQFEIINESHRVVELKITK